jgi:hypothetical protein
MSRIIFLKRSDSLNDILFITVNGFFAYGQYILDSPYLALFHLGAVFFHIYLWWYTYESNKKHAELMTKLEELEKRWSNTPERNQKLVPKDE